VSPAGTGPTGTIEVVEDVPAAFAATVVEAYRVRPAPRFTLVLSGGAVARRCYEHLAAVAAHDIDWSTVDVLMGDERCVAADDPDANQRLVREALLDRVGTVGSFHPMSCEDGPAAYQRVVEAVDVLDVVHLGMGPDGHTASLFPGSDVLTTAPGTLVVRSTDPNGDNPHPRMSLTYEAIDRARLVVFTVSGASKHAAFSAVSRGEDLPAGRVRARRVLWLVDKEAAGPDGA